MGLINSTYSYHSQEDAYNKMFDQLNYYDIHVCYSKLKNQYFVFNDKYTCYDC